MDRLRKKHLFIFGILLLLVGIVVTLFVEFRSHQQRQEELRIEELIEAEIEAEREAAELEVAHTYTRLRYAFGRARDPEDLPESEVEDVYSRLGVYGPLIVNPGPNRHRIWVGSVLSIKFLLPSYRY